MQYQVFKIFLAIIDSNKRHITQVKKMGLVRLLEARGCSLSHGPLLSIGITTASFHW